MLSVLRQSANSWFMIIIFAVITIVFVFTFGSWGGGDVSGEMPVAATVNGRVVSLAQFNALYSNTFRRYGMFKPGYGLEDAKRDRLKETVLDRLVAIELLAQEAEARGIRISDEEVVDTVKERFFRDEEFDMEQYKRIVNGVYQTNEARFEEQIRRELMGNRLEMVLTESQQVSPNEVKEAFNSRYNRASLKVLRLDPQFWRSSYVEPAPDAIAKWADEHLDEVQANYNKHITRYRKEKQVRARHILIKAEQATASGEEREAAKKKAEDALAKVKAPGADFAELARTLSEDGTASRGGDLGFFEKGTMLGGDFEQVAFSLKPGEISGVVESGQGFHVLKVEEVKEAEIQPLDAVKVDIAKTLMRDDWTKQQALSRAEKALTDLKAGTAMADLKLEGFTGELSNPGEDRLAPRVEETGWFNQGARFVPKVGISDEVVRAAFTLTDDNPVAPKVFEVANRVYVLKLKEREQPDEAKFGEERDTIVNGLLSQRRQRIVDQFLEQLKATAVITKNPSAMSYGSS